jgi:hypothetical protein
VDEYHRQQGEGMAAAGLAAAKSYWDAFTNMTYEGVGTLREINEKYAADQATAQAEYNASFQADQDRNLAIWQASMKGRLEIAQQTTQGLSSMFGNLANAMDRSSRKGFEMWKAASTAQAIVDTISSAVASYKAMAGIPYVGPYLGAAAAAAALAAGYANVRKIQSTKFGDRSGPGGGAGYGTTGGGGATASAGDRADNASANAESPSRMVTNQFNITLRGQSYSRDQVRGLLAELSNAQADSGNVYNVATSPGA